jgi:hypothetical protein
VEHGRLGHALFIDGTRFVACGHYQFSMCGLHKEEMTCYWWSASLESVLSVWLVLLHGRVVWLL